MLRGTLKYKFYFCAAFCSLFLSLVGCAFLVRTSSGSFAKESSHPYRGSFHVHSHFSHDSKATLETIQDTARKVGFDFVIVTDHNNIRARTALEQKPLALAPLLIVGEEVSTSAGHLISLGVPEDAPRDLSPQDLVHWIHERGGIAILAHPYCKKNPWRDWELRGFDGLEVYNFGHTFFEANIFLTVTQALFLPPVEFLKVFQRTPHEAFASWDEKLRDGKVLGFGASDAHIHWKRLEFSPENFLMNLQSTSTYVLAEGLSEEKIVAALKEGKSFIALEARGDARQFSFIASSASQSYGLGETVPSETPVSFSVKVPEVSEIRLIHNGEVIQKSVSTELTHEVRGTGVYRVEVYRDGKIWIFSNPIYVAA